MTKQKPGVQFILLIIIFLIFNIVLQNVIYASSSNTILQIVQASSEIKDLPNEHGIISTVIAESDLENGEVTIEVKLENLKDEITTGEYSNTEIYILIPILRINQAKYNELVDNVEVLTTKIFDSTTNVKVGIISVGGTMSATEEGALSNADILVMPTENIEDILDAINSISVSTGRIY